MYQAELSRQLKAEKWGNETKRADSEDDADAEADEHSKLQEELEGETINGENAFEKGAEAQDITSNRSFLESKMHEELVGETGKADEV